MSCSISSSDVTVSKAASGNLAGFKVSAVDLKREFQLWSLNYY